MKRAENLLLPPQRLAVAYASPGLRESFGLLLEFDTKLWGLVRNASEPLIGQMKLAWWRDALAMESERRPKGEPLLKQLAAIHRQDVGAAMLKLVDAWEILLVGNGSLEMLHEFAALRGNAVFAAYAGWVGSTADVGSLATHWAVADLTGKPIEIRANDLSPYRDRKLRPLTILALSVRDVSGPRLLWHALTGR